MIKEKLKIIHVACCFCILTLSACGEITESPETGPTEVVFDPSSDKIAGGIRLAPPKEDQWDGYGEAVDVYGDVLVVGAPESNHFGPGSAYVYRFSDGEWHEESQLIAGNRDEFNELTQNRGSKRLGSSVAAQDGVIAVGAPGYVQPTNTGYRGEVYVFEYRAQAWVETAKLTPSQMSQDTEQERIEWSNHSLMPLRAFGALVALSGDALAVGGDAGGLVYMYQRGTTGWQEQAHINLPGMPGRDLYTSSLSLFGDTLAVSTFYVPPQPEGPSFATGSLVVYVYERTGNSWKEGFRFVPDDGTVDYLFPLAINVGASVALGGDSGQANLLAIGLPGFPDWTGNINTDQIFWGYPNIPLPKSNRQSGEVYIFEKGKNDSWSQRVIPRPMGWDDPPGPGSVSSVFPSYLEELSDAEKAEFYSARVFPGHIYSEAPEISFFGATVALDGNLLAVTSGFANATYIFERIDGDWTYQFSLKPKNEKVELWEDYTQNVSLNDRTLLVGTPSEFGNSAYVFDLCVPSMLDCR